MYLLLQRLGKIFFFFVLLLLLFYDFKRNIVKKQMGL